MKRVFATAAIIDSGFLAFVFYTPIKDFLFAHQWFLTALAAAPALVITFLELRHSGEANELRREANVQRDRANEALAKIAAHTKKTPTKGEKNAERLQKY